MCSGRRHLREVPVDELLGLRRLGVERVNHAEGLRVAEDEAVVVLELRLPLDRLAVDEGHAGAFQVPNGFCRTA